MVLRPGSPSTPQVEFSWGRPHKGKYAQGGRVFNLRPVLVRHYPVTRAALSVVKLIESIRRPSQVTSEGHIMAKGSTWAKRIVLGIVGLIVLLLVAVVGALLYFQIPTNASAMAAESVCSAAFMAGRPTENLMADDVLPASAVLKAISVDVDETNHSVKAKFAGLFPRQASLLPNRGCVLDEAPDPASQAYVPTSDLTQPWPAGDAPIPASELPAGVNMDALNQVVEQAFVGAGDPAAANARGVAVVKDGKLLTAREAPGFENGTGLMGWSMTKSVGGMLAYKVATDAGLDFGTPVVDAFPADQEPEWVAQWRTDERANITVADLVFMRDGLANTESYDPWSAVPQMLYGEPNMAQWAAEKPAEVPAGTRWQYLSATSNILAAVARGQFDSDAAYWAYPQQTLFDPIGAKSASLATDTAGTWVSSSYLWADVTDWARFGQLGLQDGQWNGTQVLPPGWQNWASQQAMTQGEGAGYGA